MIFSIATRSRRKEAGFLMKWFWLIITTTCFLFKSLLSTKLLRIYPGIYSISFFFLCSEEKCSTAEGRIVVRLDRNWTRSFGVKKERVYLRHISKGWVTFMNTNYHIRFLSHIFSIEVVSYMYVSSFGSANRQTWKKSHSWLNHSSPLPLFFLSHTHYFSLIFRVRGGRES